MVWHRVTCGGSQGMGHSGCASWKPTGVEILGESRESNRTSVGLESTEGENRRHGTASGLNRTLEQTRIASCKPNRRAPGRWRAALTHFRVYPKPFSERVLAGSLAGFIMLVGLGWDQERKPPVGLSCVTSGGRNQPDRRMRDLIRTEVP